MDPLRLNRFLASAGVASRRRCDDFIRAGRVSVGGEVVVELGTRVVPGVDVVTVDGVQVEIPQEHWTLALNKPRDVLVSASDTRGRTTVYDLIEDAPGRVFPVGRLDYRSEGLLVFTNDGDLAYRLAHPRFKVDKLYRVEVDGKIEAGVIDALSKGVVLEEGRTQPAVVRVAGTKRGRTVVEIELREGRKRQIRRMFGLFGNEVRRLKRMRFGPLELGALPAGKWRILQPAEIHELREAVGLPDRGAEGETA